MRALTIDVEEHANIGQHLEQTLLDDAHLVLPCACAMQFSDSRGSGQMRTYHRRRRDSSSVSGLRTPHVRKEDVKVVNVDEREMHLPIIADVSQAPRSRNASFVADACLLI